MHARSFTNPRVCGVYACGGVDKNVNVEVVLVQ